MVPNSRFLMIYHLKGRVRDATSEELRESKDCLSNQDMKRQKNLYSQLRATNKKNGGISLKIE
jgi:hypothetical protein